MPMPAFDPRDEVCLGIAVDHRILRLFNTVQQPYETSTAGTPGTHVESLQNYGRELKRSEAEIKVTSELASPSTMGGIVVVLQQPRDDHPFHKGIDAVIDDCATLQALDDVFCKASRGSIDIREHVSVIDLLPFTGVGAERKMGPDELVRAFRASTEAVCGKKPDVVLCAGRFYHKYEQQKGQAKNLESLGVGFVYLNAANLHGDTGDVSITRVNGFHPSYAVNHRPELSELRQLLILTVVETCTKLMAMDEWDEKPWMKELREVCAKKSRSDRGKFSDAGVFTSGKGRRMYMSSYKELLVLCLNKVRTALKTLPSLPNERSLFYERLLESRISESYNNLCLLLAGMRDLNKKNGYNTKDWQVLQVTAEAVRVFVADLDGCNDIANRKLRRHTQSAAAAIKRCLDTTSKGNLRLNLDQASRAFLDTAVGLERILRAELEALTTEGTPSTEIEVDNLGAKVDSLSLQTPEN